MRTLYLAIFSTIAFLFTVVTLAGCAAPVGAPPTNTVAANVVCPPVVVYTLAEQNEAATELAGLPEGGEVRTMLADYHREREELKACAGKK